MQDRFLECGAQVLVNQACRNNFHSLLDRESEAGQFLPGCFSTPIGQTAHLFAVSCKSLQRTNGIGGSTEALLTNSSNLSHRKNIGQLKMKIEKHTRSQANIIHPHATGQVLKISRSKQWQRVPGICLLVMFASLLLVEGAAAQTATTPGNRFEKNVLAYEASDKAEAPPKGAILLVGDSQFYRWKTLHEDLPEYTIVNRGIDSFQFSDILYFMDRIVLPYKARMIILHVGGNDVHTGKSAERVLEDFKAFVARVRAVQPSVPIAFSSITPGPGRWEEADKRKQTNRLIKDYIATQKNLYFIDLWDAMLTSDGQPREDLWVADRIHPNHDGYLLRVKIMRPILGKPDKKTK